MKTAPDHESTLPDLHAGRVLFGYVLERSLGGGGFGEVWLAANELDPLQKVAIKFPRLDQARSLELLTREAQHYRSLVGAMTGLADTDRPPIVPILRDCTADSPPAIIMEYVEGGDLRSWMMARPDEHRALDENEAIAIVADIARALAFAHQHNLVHRDLSPENVLFDPDRGRWLVTDFGLGAHATEEASEDDLELSIALSRAESTQLSTLAAGKAHYMAPEQFRHGVRVGPAADVFALGVLWAQLLLGDLDSGLPATWYPSVPNGSRELIFGMLQTKPEARMTIAELLEKAGGPVTAGTTLPGNARTFVVDVNGGPNRHRTINGALEHAKTGDTVLLMPGVYEESLVITEGISLVGDRERSAIIQWQGEGPAVLIDAEETATLQWLHLRGLASEGGSSTGVSIRNSSPRVAKCLIEGFSLSGIHVLGEDADPEIQDNTLVRNGYGMTFYKGARGDATENVITNNLYDGVSLAHANTNPVIKRNEIHENGRNGIRARDMAGGAAIENSIKHNKSYGLVHSENSSFVDADNVVVYNGEGPNAGGPSGLFQRIMDTFSSGDDYRALDDDK